jgi:hypothetical protein
MSLPAGSPAGRPTSKLPSARTPPPLSPAGTARPSSSISSRANACATLAALHGTSSLIAMAIGGRSGPVTDHPPPST